MATDGRARGLRRGGLARKSGETAMDRTDGGTAAPGPDRGRILPGWAAWFFVGAAVVLIPWIVYLFTSDAHQVALTKHWRLVWGGFDCFLVLGFALTAYRIATRSPRGAITATATGTMLFVDAWFDVLTSRRPVDTLTAVLMALFAEIPCGLICFYVARRIIGVFEASLPVLRAAGFRYVGGRLVPPAEGTGPGAGAGAGQNAELADQYASSDTSPSTSSAGSPALRRP
jgi:hypothetical protein